MTTTAKTCAHPRCDERVAGHELACPPHWAQLPVLLRNRIWRNWKRNPGGKAHIAAIGQARAHWWKQVSETELRCAHCKSKHNILLDDDTPTCLTCLGPDLERLARPGAGILRCPRCGRDVIGLVSIGDGPQICCACQVETLAA